MNEAWFAVDDHRQELQRQPQAKGFEFKLYRLSFLNTLQQQGVMRNSCGSSNVKHAFMFCNVYAPLLICIQPRKQTGQDL